MIGSRPRPDAAKLVRGAIAGIVVDDARRPIANARVCADGDSPNLPGDATVCATTDASGAYALEQLVPAHYTVSAALRSYMPEVGEPLALRAGERANVDLTLRAGGVELTGVVSDLAGGPVAHAQIRSSRELWGEPTAIVHAEADDQGRFTMWVAPGEQHVRASADGYADGTATASVPAHVAIALTPEATLAGNVVDDSGQPVEGARVAIASGDEFVDDWQQIAYSDASGEFRFPGLEPGRYQVAARAEHGFGRSPGTTLVGLAHHVTGVIVRLAPAVAVSGRVVVATTRAPCPDARVELHDSFHRHTAVLRSDGDALRGEGVPAGTYTVDVTCAGFGKRDTYPQLAIGTADVTDVVWEVDVAATVRGRVTRNGAPVANALVRLRPDEDRRLYRSWIVAATRGDGTYALSGVPAGNYHVLVRGVGHVGGREPVTVPASGIVERDVAMAPAGTIRGVVVDGDGRPLPGTVVFALPGEDSPDDSALTDAAGAFILDDLDPGAYHVVTADHRGDPTRSPPVAVRADEVTTVRLVGESRRGTIRGTVVDARGVPVADGFVVATRNHAADANLRERPPTPTSSDGSFTIDDLEAGDYHVRAYREGDDKALADNVPVGATIRLQLRATGAIRGTAHLAGSTLDDLRCSASAADSRYTRREWFTRTGGVFAFTEMPAGTYQLECVALEGEAQLRVTLAEGQSLNDLDLTLERFADVTGRVVDLRTHAPIAGIKVNLDWNDDHRPAPFGRMIRDVTDANGTFRLRRAHPGPIRLTTDPSGDDRYRGTTVERVVPRNAARFDAGDLEVLAARAPRNAIGKLGFSTDYDTELGLADRRLRVDEIDPAGPAARTGLALGDVITHVDGLAVTGAGSEHWDAAIAVPAGTRLSFTLARGTTIAVTLE